jgi:hypothetical protein
MTFCSLEFVALLYWQPVKHHVNTRPEAGWLELHGAHACFTERYPHISTGNDEIHTRRLHANGCRGAGMASCEHEIEQSQAEREMAFVAQAVVHP